MDINYQGQELRKERTREFWVQIANDFNGNNKENKRYTVEELREKYKKTDGSKYSRAYIYQIFNKLKTK